MSLYELSPDARHDLLAIQDYYLDEKRSASAAEAVFCELGRGFQQIARTPWIGHRREDLTNRDVRFLRIGAYFIVYRPDPSPVRVVRILHGSRDIGAILIEGE